MGIAVNFDNVETSNGGDFTPIPDGIYSVVVAAAEERTSSKGTPGISLRLCVSGGEHAGRVIFDNLWVTERAMGRVLYVLRCMGITPPKGTSELTAEALVGRTATVDVASETGQDGRVWPRVKDWLTSASRGSDLPTLAPAAAPAAPADDDIPF